jgi:hypothetical protein
MLGAGRLETGSSEERAKIKALLLKWVLEAKVT